ncbi:MAG: hypothetical protein ACXVLT_07455 [Flavisolibacter sp.]
MNKNFVLLIIAGAVVTGCQKNDQLLSEDSSKANFQKSSYLDHKSNSVVKQCQITQVSYVTNGTTDVLQFTYNSLGDPVSITRLNGASTGRPNYTFEYNSKNQLSDFIGPYSTNSYAEFWHKYFYDSNGNIVMDSTYIFPNISSGAPQNAYSSSLTYYIYDAAGRITKDSTPSLNKVVTYAYDATGNRIGASYDNNVSVYRTNALWMFLNKNYSVNNSLNTSSFNATGLPLSFTSSGGSAFNFLGNDYTDVQFTYDCSGKVNK